MNKIVFAALAATAAVAAPAAAQDNRSVAINVEGAVALQCEVIANPSIVNPEVIVLSDTAADQSLGSLTYRCNNAGGFTRTMSSGNNGVLKRAGGGANESTIAYQVGHTGGSGLTLANTSLASPVSTALAGSTAFIAGQTGSVKVRIGAASGALYAGTYGDTITVSIAPNN